MENQPDTHPILPSSNTGFSQSRSADTSQPEYVRGAKRQRLSTACNQCRKRKVRCDEKQPRCRNCTVRGDECITTNPNVPSREVIRRRTNTASLASDRLYTSVERDSPSNFSAAPEHRGPQQVPSRSSKRRENIGPSPSTSPHADSPQNLPERHTNYTAQKNTCEEQRRQSPEYSYDREMILNTGHSSPKRKLLGGGTLQALAKYLDRYFEHKGWELINSRFAFGMEHSEEIRLHSLGSAQPLPAMPSLPDLEIYLSTFRQRIYPLYPLLDFQAFKIVSRRLISQDLRGLAQEDIPTLSCLYSLLAVASDEAAGCYTAIGLSYLSAAYGLSAYVTSMSYMSSVQAMLLLTVALRARNKDGVGWQTLGQAIRIAQSIGLHRRTSYEATRILDSDVSKGNVDLDARVWWTCYCLEKTMGLEVGRPVSILDIDCNQIHPNAYPHSDENGFFHLWIGLAKIQSRLIDALYHRPRGRRNALSLLQDIGRIDRELCDWAEAVQPEEIRPGSDILCAPNEFHLATFLSMHYYQTLIAVHQAALMLDAETYQAKLEQYCKDNPWQGRLRGSESILLSSARSIACLQMDLGDRRIKSRLFTVTQIMLSMMIIAFNIMKHPDAMRNRLDVELLRAMSIHAEAEYASAGINQEFIEGIRVLRSQIQRQVYGESEDQRNTQVENGPHIPSFQESDCSGSASIPTEDDQDQVGNYSINTTESLDPSLYLVQDLQLDHPWNWLLSDEVETSPEYSLWNEVGT